MFHSGEFVKIKNYETRPEHWADLMMDTRGKVLRIHTKYEDRGQTVYVIDDGGQYMWEYYIKDLEKVTESSQIVISMDKEYRTKNGVSVRILCVDAPGDYPVCAMVLGSGDPSVKFYTINGVPKSPFHDCLVEFNIAETFHPNQQVMVRATNFNEWERRYFCKYQNGTVFCFEGGATTWTAKSLVQWPQVRLPTEEELKCQDWDLV